MWVRHTSTGTSETNQFRLGDPKAQRFLPLENRRQHAAAMEYVDDAVDEQKVFLGAESHQRRLAVTFGALTYRYVGLLQLCGCIRWEVVLERYCRRCPQPLICLQILKSSVA